MKCLHSISGGILIAVLLLSSCTGGTGGGPQVWIDQPLEAHNPHPLGNLTLQAHASDSDGVASIEFSIDGEIYETAHAGGGRLGQIAILWNPPGPGTYTISAQAEDNSGLRGNLVSSTIIIAGEEPLTSEEDEPVETQELIVTESPTPEEKEEPLETEPPEEPETPLETEPPQVDEPPVEEPQASIEPIAIAQQNSNCRAGPSSRYRILGNLMEEQQAPIVGRSADWSWLVVSIDGGSIDCWIAAYLVTVEGNVDTATVIQPPPLPITDTPTPTGTATPTPTKSITPTPTPTQTEPPPPPPPPPDTTPPTITSIMIFFPNPIYHGNCSGEVTTSNYSLYGVYDDSGIATVVATWTLEGETGDVYFQTSDGTTYGAIFGPFYDIGEVNMHGSVIDNAGNFTPFLGSVTVISCLG